MGKTTIAWAHYTRNFWEGCTRVSLGCDRCYAADRDRRFHKSAHWGTGAPRLPHLLTAWNEIALWNRGAAKAGERRRVFINSLSDFFDNEVPWIWRWIAWRVIRQCSNLDFILVTKRIGNVPKMLPGDWGDGYPNVWLVITVVNQEEADRDVPKLLGIAARVRGLSCEPLLGPITIPGFCSQTSWCPICHAIVADSLAVPHEATHEVSSFDEFDPARHCMDVPAKLQWVITGGESGRGARYFDVEWARDIREQCQASGVAFFLKQMGRAPRCSGITAPGAHWPAGVNRNDTGRGHFEVHLQDGAGADPREWPEDLRIQEFPQ